MQRKMYNSGSWPRRNFLVASGLALAGLGYGPPVLASESDPTAPSEGKNASGRKARSTILFFLCGGASHIDTWDMKPKAPAEYRGEFQPIATSAPGVVLCEHLPLLARQAHHLAVVNSVGASVNTNDHHAGYYYNLTGHEPDRTFKTLGNNRTPMPDDWPYMGTVVGSRTKAASQLPRAITLPYMPSRKPYTRPGQFAGRLGVQFDPLYVMGDTEKPLEFSAPSLTLAGDVDVARLNARGELLASLDDARREFDKHASVDLWNKQQERAFTLLGSSQTTAAFDVAAEPEKVRERYGSTVNAMSLLMARRLVEAGVPFITVFWQEKPKLSTEKCSRNLSWDTHADNFNCLKNKLLPQFDQCFSALIEDLADRGLLDETMLLVTSEMGRKSKIGDPRSGGGSGRDHWTHCLTNVLAGGGIQGGQVYGSSDRFAQFPAEKPVTPAHIAKTVYHAMGVTNLEARDPQNRPYNLLEAGTPLLELF